MSWKYICWGLYYYSRGLSICMNSGRGGGSHRAAGRWIPSSGRPFRIINPTHREVAAAFRRIEAVVSACRDSCLHPMRPVAVAISTQLVFDFLYFFIFRVLLIISSAADFELVTKSPEFFYCVLGLALTVSKSIKPEILDNY